jgi:hypothetical protein
VPVPEPTHRPRQASVNSPHSVRPFLGMRKTAGALALMARTFVVQATLTGDTVGFEAGTIPKGAKSCQAL